MPVVKPKKSAIIIGKILWAILPVAFAVCVTLIGWGMKAQSYKDDLNNNTIYITQDKIDKALDENKIIDNTYKIGTHETRITNLEEKFEKQLIIVNNTLNILMNTLTGLTSSVLEKNKSFEQNMEDLKTQLYRIEDRINSRP